ncbi:MAG: FAD-binding oxidoreductase [Betaproteobacteria bacterium]|nr:MAG: FAD-binding oxidoreductase [Betaproteobacteria bacterium]TMH80625.1 MAG: FAD-binding oxidoreductase [Betaproteobacteria bacterium]
MRSFIEEIQAIVGPAGLITLPQEVAPYASDWRKRYVGKPAAVVKPASTAEVAEVVRACAESRTAIVPQGGNTGLCGAATPDASGTQIVLNLSRMNRVRAIDTRNNTMTVEAGCVLAKLQNTAEEAGRLFPLSLAAEGSCEIGGNLSTNAGGTAVLRYGNARELVLGLEVVLPSGEVWDGLRGLRKDNTGYDLKQLFIGAEGTLGVITAAVLKLFPLPKSHATAVVALETPEKAVALLERALGACGERLTGFELFSDFCLSLVLKHFGDTAAPFPRRFPHYVLMELSDTQSGEGVRVLVESMLEAALEERNILDAAVAQSETQSRAFWSLREFISEAQAHEGPNIKHDVSIPISRISEFIATTDAELERAYGGLRMVTFGHLGDGNLHYNVSAPEGVAPGVFVMHTAAINRIVHDSVARLGGSISAEHGLGQLKRDEIQRYKSPLELELMRKLKRALDPQGIMNPGKVL